MRVVFDTNIIVSGLLWKGATSLLFDAVERGDLTLCITQNIFEEINRVFSYPHIKRQLKLNDLQPDTVLSHLLRCSVLYEDIHAVALVHDDPSDDMFLNCALASNAHWIVSGDTHLKKIGKLGYIRIVSPATFKRIIQL